MITPLPTERLTLETERLRLTPLAAPDVDIFEKLLCDPAVMKYVGGVMTPDEVAKEMAKLTRRGAGGRIGVWCAALKDTGEKIGEGVLTPIPIDDDDTDWSQVVPDAYPQNQIEVGYLLTPSAWGRGLASEICARLLQFAFEETSLAEVVAVTDRENLKSQNVLTKSGMRLTGRGRAYAEDDLPWFEITRDEWGSGKQ